MKRNGIKLIVMLLFLSAAYLVPLSYRRAAEQSSAIPDTQQAPVVLLDAGHGAADSGKVGVNGALEKDINLSITLTLKEKLEKNGIHTVLSRESDEALYSENDSNKKLADMQKRIAAMEEGRADFAVSIHQNSYGKESVSGAQVFYYTGSIEGQKLAQAIQEHFDYALGEKNTRSIKENKEYYILVKSPIPTVICECGFLSNWEEAEALVTTEYQEKIAESICRGILSYLANRE